MHTIVKIVIASLCCYVMFVCLTYSSTNSSSKSANTTNEFTKNTTPAKHMRAPQSKALSRKTEYPSEYSDFPEDTFEMDVEGLGRSINPFYILGAYPPLDKNYQSFKFGKVFNKHLLEEDYCERVDLYNLEDTDRLLTSQNFFTDFPAQHLPRALIMDQIGDVLVPEYEWGNKKERFKLSEKINFFHMDSGIMHLYMRMGTNFLCATQVYNHIPGIQHLSAKDKVVNKAFDYLEKYQDKPKCFNKTSLFPETFRLYEKEECKQFFDMLNSQKYKETLKEAAIQWMIKVGYGVHKSEGVFLLDANETKRWKKEFENGVRCGEDNRTLIAQKYVNNPLLLDLDNKFDFRVYMLIASTNPMIVYYHDGFLRVSLNKYAKNSSDRATHLTNTYLANQVIADAKENDKKINNMTEAELKEYILWSYDRFLDYLLKTKKVTDPKWLDNYLRPAFHKAMIHLARMSKNALWKGSNVYAMHGVDFMLDDQMNLWFIESNPSPLVTGTTKWRTYYSLLASLFDVEFAYYRSRMKRITKVVKNMQQEVADGKIVDYAKWKKLYNEASRNRLEPEFQLSKNNNFTLIMDENLQGTQAYFGKISRECL